jgi:putative phage associated protein
MKKQDKNRLSKKDRRLIKKATLKAAAKGCDEVYRIADGLKNAFELLRKQLD